MKNTEKLIIGTSSDGSTQLIIIPKDPKHFKRYTNCNLDQTNDKICNNIENCEIVNNPTNCSKCKKSLYEQVSNLMDSQNYTEAIVHLDSLLKLTPNCWKVIRKKGLCLKHLGRFSEAIEILELGLHLNPDDQYLLLERESILKIIEISENQSDEKKIIE